MRQRVPLRMRIAIEVHDAESLMQIGVFLIQKNTIMKDLLLPGHGNFN